MTYVYSNEELLENIAAEVFVCTKCSLSKNRQKAVPGVGSPRSKIMVIGEAPGRSEDIEGKPFVGAAGKFLDDQLTSIGIPRSEIFITNIVKCRPLENRDPAPNEIEACTPYLNRQIAILEPKLLITLGNHSTSYVLSKAKLPFRSITEAHGKMYEASVYGVELVIIPTYHPAAALYSGRYGDQIVKDFQTINRELGKRNVVGR